jgi:hypothetical protein
LVLGAQSGLTKRQRQVPTNAGDDLLAYLLAARALPAGEGRTFEVGGTDVACYGDLIRECARRSGLRRWPISVPVLPDLSSLWPLAALDVFPTCPMAVLETVQKALAVDNTRPVTRSRTATQSSIGKGKGPRQTACRSLPLSTGGP